MKNYFKEKRRGILTGAAVLAAINLYLGVLCAHSVNFGDLLYLDGILLAAGLFYFALDYRKWKQISRILDDEIHKNREEASRLLGSRVTEVLCRMEKENAEEAIRITRDILSGIGNKHAQTDRYWNRKETADYLHITIDTLRNWELNGLFTVKRSQNGYRIYSQEDLQRLKIIRSLRCANYSLSAILRMLRALSDDPAVNIREAIDTPSENDDIITACDRLLTSLKEAGENAIYVAGQIEIMKKMSG